VGTLADDRRLVLTRSRSAHREREHRAFMLSPDAPQGERAALLLRAHCIGPLVSSPTHQSAAHVGTLADARRRSPPRLDALALGAPRTSIHTHVGTLADDHRRVLTRSRSAHREREHGVFMLLPDARDDEPLFGAAAGRRPLDRRDAAWST
jgi:hypothetical protein